MAPLRRRRTRHLTLAIDPTRASPGDIITVWLVGPDARTYSCHTGAVLLASRDGEWEPVYLLASPRHGAEPTFTKLPVDHAGAVAVNPVAIIGAVKVKVPPVEPGDYRVQKEYFRGKPGGGGVETRMVVGTVTVVPSVE